MRGDFPSRTPAEEVFHMRGDFPSRTPAEGSTSHAQAGEPVPLEGAPGGMPSGSRRSPTGGWPLEGLDA